MRADDYVKALACLLAWREEAVNGLNGMCAVLFVVRNRALAGWSHGDWSEVIAQHAQFSSMTIPGDGQLVKYPDPREPNFIQLLQKVDGIFDNTTADSLTGGALYYADMASPGYHIGGWFDRNIAGRPDLHGRLAVVGSTTYFK